MNKTPLHHWTYNNKHFHRRLHFNICTTLGDQSSRSSLDAQHQCTPFIVSKFYSQHLKTPNRAQDLSHHTRNDFITEHHNPSTNRAFRSRVLLADVDSFAPPASIVRRIIKNNNKAGVTKGWESGGRNHQFP